MRYTINVFVESEVFEALKTDSLGYAYKRFGELIDLVEQEKLDTVAIFDNESDATLNIIAQVSSFDI